MIYTESNLIDQLSDRLQQSLPGAEAQYRMAHVGRPAASPVPSDAREAGVLALLYPRQETWHLVLIERVRKKGDRHSGQVSFPGGRREKEDAHLKDTAVREAEEEVGVNRQKVELLGELTPLYIPVSHYHVHPFVGVTRTPPKFVPQPSEVAGILEVPLESLLDPGSRKSTDLQITSEITLRNVPYFDLHNKIVWGATAMMLNELLEVLSLPPRKESAANPEP